MPRPDPRPPWQPPPLRFIAYGSEACAYVSVPDRVAWTARLAGGSGWLAITGAATGTGPGLVATHFWEPSNFTFPFGAHLVVTEVDGETGDVAIKRYIAVDDCGNILNPLIVDGQVHGGVAQGIGQALWEQAVYDDNGQLVTGEFMDYTMPRAHMMPWIESAHTTTPTPVNPLGVKGVGEAGTIGASPAVVNSVVDALSPLGVRHLDMPLTPEKLWKVISAGKRA